MQKGNLTLILLLCLPFQVADLRLALQRAEQQQARKEDYLREEISELQQVRHTTKPSFKLCSFLDDVTAVLSLCAYACMLAFF